MVHQLPDHGAGHVLHDVVVDVGRDDGHGDHLAPGLDDAPDVLVADTNNVLAVDLKQVVINQKPISGRRGVNCQGYYSAFLELESNVPGGVLKGSCFWSNSVSSFLTLCRVRVLSKGRSLMIIVMLLTLDFRSMSCTLSEEKPATFSLLICRIWSPNLK